jgi:RecA-family ATPase
MGAMMNIKNWDQLSFAKARHDSLPQPDFCLPNLIAGTVGVVAAPAGIGKTSLLMQIAVAVAAGVPVAGGLLPTPEKTGKVVFLATEDPVEVLQRRAHFILRTLEEQGASSDVVERVESNLDFYCIRSNAPILLWTDDLGKYGLDRLDGLARDTRLLILDPIRRFHYCDEQNYSQMAMLFGLLSNIASSNGCTILFSHHVPQPVSDADLGSPAGALGSNAFINATRWVLNLSGMSQTQGQHLRVTEDQRQHYVLASFTKTNYGEAIPARWLRRSDSCDGVLTAFDFE